VRVQLQLHADQPTEASLLLAVARRPGTPLRAEELTITGPDGPVALSAEPLPDGTVLHHTTLPTGDVTVAYEAVVEPEEGEGAALTVTERWEYTRPSRFCPSDRLARTAAVEFGSVARADMPRAVADWVAERTAYVSGSSTPTDGALETLVDRQGVCRDFAHLTTALLRALDVPARLAAVYAPGLSPMDFHAVVEAAPEGRWEVVDATRLAPRSSLVRISAGRDAADTAFLTTAGDVRLDSMSVLAVVDGQLPVDDHRGRVTLR
jgi:transglutaminase-like putative cysteine protease